ncbi:MAG: pyrroline-5-carboxylate reductase [Pikeienuella sp.]|uniref:pyrroline-5-carboxylate reductase n=1 Tax=Pikeienuella sp. TaxID=2831957 RepID=UPI0039196806
MGETLVLAGCGNMGRAMLAGWMKARPGLAVHVVEPADALREAAAALGARAVAAPGELPEGLAPDLVFLAVKPQVMPAVLPDYARLKGAVFVSVAAGTTIATLRAGLGAAARVIRVMPNTPAAIGAGMSVLCPTPEVPEAAVALTEALMATTGDVARIDDEGLMDAVTAVSGSGPAYVFHLIETLAAAGAAAGLPEALSLRLARQTVMGAGKLAAESAAPPGTLREQVTSPNGTTAAALSVLMAEDGLAPLMRRAVAAAKARGEALARE